MTLAQPILAQTSKPDLNQQLTMYAKPAVVRIVSICECSYDWHPKGKTKPSYKTFPYDISFIGTGFG